MLRNTPIDTRFNVAMFGVMGYELYFKEMGKQEKRRCLKLVDIYKENRKTFQFGDLYVLEGGSDNFRKWQVLSEDRLSSVVGHFNVLQKSNAPEAFLNTKDLIDDKIYKADVIHVDHDIHKFGGLINMITPIHLNPNGWLVNTLSKHITMPGEKDNYIAYGSTFNNRAVILNPEWSASGFNDYVRVLGDFGSRIYTIKAHEEN